MADKREATCTAPVPELTRRGRVLDPIDRKSEVLFGLFMMLTFIGTLSVATAGEAHVRTMLIAAIGRNIAGASSMAWYVLRGIVARGRHCDGGAQCQPAAALTILENRRR